MTKIKDHIVTTNEAHCHIWVCDNGTWLRFTEDAYNKAKTSAEKNPEDKPKVGILKKFLNWLLF